MGRADGTARPWLTAALGGIAVAAAVRAIGYADSTEPPPQLSAIDGLAPFWIYSLIWITAAAIALVAATTRRWFDLAIAANAAIWGVWGAAYTIAFAAGWSGRAYLTGSAFLLIALLIATVGQRARATHDV